MAVTSSRKATVTLPADDQILITREFDARRQLVYQAMTTPELVKRWWHANRGVVTHAEMDVRVGFHGEYRELVPDERIVSTEAYEGAPDPDGNATVNTVTLSDHDGRTLMTVLVHAPSKAVRDAIVESGMEAGMQDAYTLLEEVAASLR